jgi:hypothetical protein
MPDALPKLRRLKEAGCPMYTRNACQVAAKKGDLDSLVWLLEQGCDWSDEIFNQAIANDHMHVIHWAREKILFPAFGILGSTPSSPQHLIWLLDNGARFSDLALHEAAERAADTCNREMLELLDNLIPGDRSRRDSLLVSLCRAAARAGDLATLKWGLEECRHAELGPRLCAVAAGSGQLEVLMWLRKKNCPWDSSTCFAAAEGHFEILRWAREQGCPWDKQTMAGIALEGTLELLKWAMEGGCPWDERTCLCAAQKGKLNILKWAKEEGRTGEGVMSGALREGRPEGPEIVKWCWENGDKWDTETFSEAVKYENLDFLKWLRARGCPWTVQTFYHALGTGNLKILGWLKKKGCPYDEPCWYAAMEDLDALKFLQDSGCPSSLSFAAHIANLGNLGTLTWAIKNGHALYLRNEVWVACAKKGFLELLQWCHRNIPEALDYSTKLRIPQVAASGGNLEILKYLKSIGVLSPGNNICRFALEGQHWGCAKWLLEEGGSKWTTKYFGEVRGADPETRRWMDEFARKEEGDITDSEEMEEPEKGLCIVS